MRRIGISQNRQLNVAAAGRAFRLRPLGYPFFSGPASPALLLGSGPFAPADPFFNVSLAADPFMVSPLFGVNNAIAPPVHVARADDGGLLVEVEVPRFGPDDVTVTADKERGVISVKGKCDWGNFVFERTFSVNTDVVDVEKLTSEVRNGVLTIKVPHVPPPAVEANTTNTTSTDDSATEKKQVAATTQSTVAADDAADARAVYDAAAEMTWPPQFSVEDSATSLVYTCALPESVRANNIDVHLERGAYLQFAVRCNCENVQKDAKGNVTFAESRSLNYATPLRVPRGTVAGDVSVALKKGKLRITVKKHGEYNPRIIVDELADW